MAKKKVALVNVFFAPQAIGGATRVLMDNVEVLREHYGDRFDLTAFTSDAEHWEESYRMDAYYYRGIPVYRVGLKFQKGMDWTPSDERMGRLFGRFLEREKPDLVHFHCIQRLTASIVEECERRGIPFVVTLHDAWWISDYQFLVDRKGKVHPMGHPDGGGYTPPAGISMQSSQRRISYLKERLSKAAKLFSVSESFARIYRANGVENIVVTKNGISSKIPWRPKETGETPRVVCGHIGGMSEHKGFPFLREAAVAGGLKNVEFLVVDHSKESGYEAHESWGGSPVRVIGRIPQEEIVDLYSKIDVLFAPSIWPESFGLVTREAAACGCWVVAGNLGGIGEDVEEGVTGFVIEPSTRSVREVLERIDADPARYKAPAPVKKIRYVDEQVDELVEWYEKL